MSVLSKFVVYVASFAVLLGGMRAFGSVGCVRCAADGARKHYLAREPVGPVGSPDCGAYAKSGGVCRDTEIGTYIDQPMRSYSSGMKARLGFAFASLVETDILVVDEALSVGDRVFSKKCLARVKEIMSGANVTVLFVTHSLSMARQFCSRGIVLDTGRMAYGGPIADALPLYESMG